MESKFKNRRFKKSKRKRQYIDRKKDWLEWTRVTISAAKLNVPDQTAIIFTKIELSGACKSLLPKGPNFVFTPYDIN